MRYICLVIVLLALAGCKSSNRDPVIIHLSPVEYAEIEDGGGK
jgi:uncharacterized protein YcfL